MFFVARLQWRYSYLDQKPTLGAACVTVLNCTSIMHVSRESASGQPFFTAVRASAEAIWDQRHRQIVMVPADDTS